MCIRDRLYLACEGTMVIIAPKEEAAKIVETLRQCPYSENAAIIGEITEEQPGKVVMMTEIGTCLLYTSSLISSMKEYNDRFYYLMMDETDIVTGRHLKKIPKAVEEICSV